MKKAKPVLKNTVIWLIAIYPMAYLAGAIVMTIGLLVPAMSSDFKLIELPELLRRMLVVYEFGIHESLRLFMRMAPIFLVLANIYLRIPVIAERWEKKWASTVLFALLMGLISSQIVAMDSGVLRPSGLLAFMGGFIGTLLPRVLIKRLRPGMLV